MFLLGNFFKALAEVVNIFFSVWVFLFVGRAIISFVSPDPYNPIVRFLRDTTEPVINPIRRVLPSGLRNFPLDISFLLGFLLIVFVKEFSVTSLYQVAEFFKRI
ncbi:MAG: YggT family protein [Deltaproteobacteria bacterium]|nr:YggT family protein [Deltaproteobacteria bacterium]